MDKLNITEGKWEIDNTDIGATFDTDWWVRIARCHSRDNAKAIVTAVNNTYKRGIDPEAVPDMFDALVDVNNYNEEPCQEHYDIMMKSVKSALKKAEL